MSKKNVIWLASYPKSGNTWLRVFLTNLLHEKESPANINDLTETSISSSRKIFDDYTGLSSSDLSFKEIDRLRPEVYKMQSAETNDILFKKVHDKFYFVDKDKPLFPPEISLGAIYIIRNPLDVAVSFSYHSVKPLDIMIRAINNHTYAFCDKNSMQQNQLRQILGSWSDHVKSWTEQDLIPHLVIRYEDMILDTFTTFKKAVDFLKIEKSDSKIIAAIEKSDFSVLSKQEKESGFKERMIKSESFFRKGKIGDWRNHLNEHQKNELVETHETVMKLFGYLNNKNKLTF
jgi:hypothetical protein